MGLFDWFGSTGDSSSDRPPKPDDDTGQKEVEATRYEATVHYRNGESESFECYGIYSRGDDVVKFNTNPYAKRNYKRWATYSYDRRKINYETLAREPTLTKLAEDTFVIDYTITHKYTTRLGLSIVHGKRKWRAIHQEPSLTVNRGNLPPNA
jgi:hypothetical protein